MKGLPHTSYELDFYTSADGDPSGHGEGQEWLGTATVTTDAPGLAPFFVSFPTSTPAGRYVAATSTGQVNTSEFSNSVVVLADRDCDGVADAEEDGGPYSGDADRDGTLDRFQTDVATLRNTGDPQYLTLKAPAGSTLYGIWAIENPSPGSSPYAMPFPLGFVDGIVEDVLAGGSTTLALLLPPGVVPHSFYQFGATAGSTYDSWYEFPFDGTTEAEIFPDRVVLHFVDGGRGDHDLEANGRIAFQGGASGPPAMHVVDTTPAENDPQAPQDTHVSVTFGEDIDPATLSHQTFFVHGSQTGRLPTPPNTLGVDRATATLAPAGPFHPGELIQVTTTPGIHSADGDAPVSPCTWEFRAAVAGGTATFAQSNVERFGFPETYGVAMKDLDGDGDPDVFFANVSPEPSTVWLNNGAGHEHFIDTGQQLGPFDGRDVVLEDLDDDGDTDAFVATFGQGNRVYFNDGHGYFTDSGQRLGDAPTLAVSLGDFDGDGDLGAFAANASGQPNSVWLNDGHGQFTDSGSYVAGVTAMDKDSGLSTPDSRTVTVTAGGPSLACAPVSLGRYRCDVYGATPGGVVDFIVGARPGTSAISRFGITVEVADPVLFAFGIAAETVAHAAAMLSVSSAQSGRTLYVQAFEETPKLWATGVIALAVPFDRRFDFGAAKSPVEAGYGMVSPRSRYTPKLGYGWTTGKVSSVDRKAGNDLDRDLNLTRDATFVVDVPNGTYSVELRLGDRGKLAHDQMGVFLEGLPADNVTTAARSEVSSVYCVQVEDGQLTVRLQDLGGRDKNVAIAGLTLVALPPPAPQHLAAASGSAGTTGAPAFGAVPRGHNALLAEDANRDGVVTPLDALLVIHYLNAVSSGALPAEAASGLSVDVSGDGVATALDALLIINHLNRSAAASAEGEAASRRPSALPTVRPSDPIRLKFDSVWETVLADIASDVSAAWRRK